MKLPEHAKRVFKGVLFDVYQWEQEVYDGSIRTFEKIVRIPSVQIIALTPEKKIIMLKEEQPLLEPFTSVPGGGVEREHGIEETCEKELLEEIGGEAEEFIFWLKTDMTSKIDWQTHYFIAKNVKIVAKPKTEGGEKIESYEVSFEEFIEETQKEKFRNKYLKTIIYRAIHTPGEIDKLKKLFLS